MTILQNISAFWQIIRPLNIFIAIVSVVVAAFMSPYFTANITLLLASVAAGLIAAGANVVNDIYDIEIDRINKPLRPLPSGRIKVRSAWILYGGLSASGIFIAAISVLPLFAIAVLNTFILYYYSRSLKGTVLWGNIAVSFASALTFIYGGLTMNDYSVGLFPAIFAFLFHLGREIIKDMQDIRGDLENNAVTFPGRFGIGKSVTLVNGIFIILLFCTFLPYIYGIYNRTYLYLVIFGVDAVLIATGIILCFKNDEAMLGKLSHLLKLDMLVGILAILIGARHVILFN